VLLKGRHTVVTDGERVYINQTGNPALATAGSGDVLTGLIAALCAQGTPAFDAAVLGAYLHGLAADRWAQRHGRSGLRAQDLADELPDAFEQRRTAT
jgi:NAD(P)H-hydrate epimerase